jgi:signal transduction histidine kinase
VKIDTSLRTSVLSCAILSYLIAFLQISLGGLGDTLPDIYIQTLYICILLSLFLSILLFFLHSPFYLRLILLVRTAVLLIVSYPFQDYLPIEIVGRMPSPYDGVLSGAVAIAGILFLRLPRRFLLSAQSPGFPGISLHELVLLGSALAGVTAVAYILKRAFCHIGKLRDLIAQLNTNIGVLTSANLAFQEFANFAEVLAAQKERERITREIHDSSGYAFTNLMALMEVAISLGGHDLDKLTDVHYQAKRQAREGLQETRRSLRRLRDAEEDRLKGIKALLKVLKTFEQVTRVKISLTLGNIRWTYGTSIDLTIYRILQEALTNSLRHGSAKAILISFWEQQGSLIINIKDDGKGVEKIEKGMGLAGMEERLGLLGGTIEIPNHRDGFHLLIRLPIGDVLP